MAENYNWTPVVMVEGLSLELDDSVRPSGLAYMNEPTQTAPEGRVTGPWRAALLSVELGELSWSPIEGNATTQELTFTLNIDAPDATNSRQGSLLRSYFLGDADPVGLLAFGEVVSPTTTSFDVTMLDGSDAADTFGPGTLLYLSAEAWRVASSTVDTITVENTVPQSFIYPDGGTNNDLTKSSSAVEGNLGHIGTRLSTHTARAASTSAPPYEDDRVFASNPRLKGRRVWLFRCAIVGGELLEQCIGQYIIASDDSIQLNDACTELTVTCVSIVGAFDEYQFNTRNVQYRYSFLTINGGSRVSAAGGISEASNFEDSVWGNYPVSVVQAGETVATLFGGTDLLPDLRFGGKSPDVTNLSSNADFDTLPDPSKRDLYNEVLASNPFDILRSADGFTLTPSPVFHPYYSTDRPDPDDPSSTSPGILRNPLHLWLAHMGCLSSNLPSHWILPFAADTVNVESVLAKARGVTGSINEWPGVVAGGDGEPIDAMKWADQTFLVPVGAARVQDQYGRIDIAFVYAPPVSSTLIRDTNTGYGRSTRRPVKLAADSFIAVIGTGVGDRPIIEVQSGEVYLPDRGTVQSTNVTIEAQGALSPDDPTTDLGTLVGRPAPAFIRAYLTSIGQWLRKGMAKIELSVGLADLNLMDPANVQPLMPGSLVDISLTGLIDIVTGAKQSADGYQGLVFSHQWTQDFTTQLISVGLYRNRLVRYGFSLLITNVVDNSDGTYTLTFDADESILPDGAGVDYLSPIGAFATDLATAENAQTDYNADDVVVVDQYFAAKFVGTLASNILTAGTLPVAGDWVVLADLGGGNNEAEAVFAYFGRDKYGV